MAAIIAACREEGWLDRITDNAQWDNLCRSFGVDLQLVVEFSEIVVPDGYAVVVMDESGEDSLEDFTHPENVIYIFGRSTLNRIQDGITHDHSVQINTVEQKGIFGVSIAGALLYARSLQWP